MVDTLSKKLSQYHPDAAAISVVHSARILLLVGPTGVGKDSIKNRLLETGQFHHIISHTTRKPRLNRGTLEKNGVEYHFIDEATAEKMLDDHAFVEAKLYSQNIYGTSVAEIQKAVDDKKIAMTDMEIQGVAEYKALDQNITAIFILPPSFKVWQERLFRRYGDKVDADDYRRRLQTALDEIKELLSTDYYTAIVNDNLEQAVMDVGRVVTEGPQNSFDDSHARQIAEQLASDIKNYLEASWHS